MAAYAYVGSSQQVGPVATLSLLVLPVAVIWCPPQAFRPALWNVAVPPAPGDTVYVCWHDLPGQGPVILGRGTLATAPNGTIMFTNASRPGSRPAARQLGYGGPANVNGGPTNMSFVHLDDRHVPTNQIQMPQTFPQSGWNDLTAPRLAWLNAQPWAAVP